MRLEPHPLDSEGTRLKPRDVHAEVRDVMLHGARLRVWDPEMVVPPAELRGYDRWLMAEPLSRGHLFRDSH